jgi:hypothetical protein
MSSLLFSSATVVKSLRVDAKCVFVYGNTLVDFGVQDRLLNVYRSFRRLEVFDARSLTLTQNTFSYFAALPGVRKFRFSIGSQELKGFVDSNSSEHIFMELTAFDIETDDLEEVARLIEQKGFGRLEH